MLTVYEQELARLDILERFVYLAENASPSVAEKFIINAEASFAELAANPLMGTPLLLSDPKFAEIRKWHVTGFDNVIIFYLPLPDGISIVRVLHSAQDWWHMFGFSL